MDKGENMKNIIFREKKLIGREKEIDFIKQWLEKIPDEILWIFGPKSTGKTTLIEYVVENELFDDFKLFKSSKYEVKYINFRRKSVYNYDSFINSMLLIDDNKLDKKLKMAFSLGMFNIEYELYNQIKEKRIDLFDTLLEKIKGSKKRFVLIIDEIQVLEELYMNGEKEVLKEFLNFCVRLTKELHVSHVVILSSNTIFINRIYNDSKLKKTSEFYKIDHLNYETTKEWLIEEGYKEKEIKMIWDYLGGCIPDIQRMMRKKGQYDDLEEYLKREAWLAYTQIMDFIMRNNTDKEEEVFIKIAETIITEGKFVFSSSEFKSYIPVVDKWAEKEILFFHPLTLEVAGNSRVFEKGINIFLKK